MKKKIKQKKKRKSLKNIPKPKKITTLRRENFIQIYLKSYNLPKAVKESNYSYAQARKILKAPEMQDYLNQKRKEMENDNKEMLHKLTNLALERTVELLSKRSLNKNSESTALSLAFRAGGLLENKNKEVSNQENKEESRKKWIEELKKRAKNE